MKTNHLLTSLAVLAVFTSCKKTYVCTCVTTVTEPAYTYNSVNYPGSVNESIEQETYEERKESNAQVQCEFKEYVVQYASPNETQGQGLTTEAKVCDLSEF